MINIIKERIKGLLRNLWRVAHSFLPNAQASGAPFITPLRLLQPRRKSAVKQEPLPNQTIPGDAQWRHLIVFARAPAFFAHFLSNIECQVQKPPNPNKTKTIKTADELSPIR